MTGQPLPDGVLRFLHLGDSYTCCEGVDPAAGWPACLHASMERAGWRLPPPRIFAKTGWTSFELLDAFQATDHGAELFDFVTLCIGVNNQYRGLSPARFEEDLQALILLAGPLTGFQPRRLLLLSIPDWGVSPFAADRDCSKISSEIDAFNHVLQQAARRGGHLWHDWTALSRTFSGQAEAFVADGLHPSATQYAAWCAQLFAGLREHLTV